VNGYQHEKLGKAIFLFTISRNSFIYKRLFGLKKMKKAPSQKAELGLKMEWRKE